jgi:hypothetical protein
MTVSWQSPAYWLLILLLLILINWSKCSCIKQKNKLRLFISFFYLLNRSSYL